jgi:pimeloyl-ACP methyl ester carboxylesterase
VQPTERFLTANRLRHHVLAWGDEQGEPVLLCHGFLDLAWSFAPLAERLAAAGYRVYAFDWRGHGETEWVGAGGYYHFPDYVLDMHELVPQLATGPVHVIGHSMGGTASVLYAATHHSHVQTLSLIEGLGPPAQPAGAAFERVTAFLKGVDRIRGQEPRPMPSAEAALARLRGQHPDLPDALGRLLIDKGTVETEGGLVWRFDPLHRTTSPTPFNLAFFATFLRSVFCPTLVVAGEKGFRLGDEAERVALIPRVRTHDIAGVGHMIHWFRPDALADCLTQFFREPR